jgi:aryl-alcohol dehydrogenase-like predicted oxidoreductase
METRTLGATGLRVSNVTLGTMTWGRDTDIHEARDQFNVYRDGGGYVLDTADGYSDGVSEEIIGEFIRDYPEILISSKAGSIRGSQSRNASRGHILTSLENSLRKLRRNQIDIWHIHAWDSQTPIDETLAAMDDAVQSGKVRYIGMSNFSGWQLAMAGTIQSSNHGSAPIASAQMEYSLLERGIEREVIPVAKALGTGIMAWSPLGRGVLTGKYRHNTPADSRGASKHFAGFVSPYLADRPSTIVDAVCVAAEALGHTPLDVALNWVLSREQVSTAVVGARTASQLRALIAGLDTRLPPEIIGALDDVSTPHLGYPEFGWNQS